MADEKKGVSRRDFLKTGSIAAGTLVGGGLIGGLVGYNMKQNTKTPTEKAKDDAEESPSTRGLMFFQKQHDFNVLAEACERIFPEDDLGPGAIGLEVPYFIDNQLAGGYGSNATNYMLGPFHEGEATQGTQTPMLRSEIFLLGIRQIDKEAKKRFDDDFTKIADEEKDEILTDFQKDDIKMKGIKASEFFNLLRSATLEGAYSDPIYNGNLNMEGWRMKGFPGHQMSYKEVIEQEDFQEMEPKSINSMY